MAALMRHFSQHLLRAEIMRPLNACCVSADNAPSASAIITGVSYCSPGNLAGVSQASLHRAPHYGRAHHPSLMKPISAAAWYHENAALARFAIHFEPMIFIIGVA